MQQDPLVQIHCKPWAHVVTPSTRCAHDLHQQNKRKTSSFISSRNLYKFSVPFWIQCAGVSTPLISRSADAVLICISTITHLEMKLDSTSWFLTAGGFASLLWLSYCCYFTLLWIFCIIKLVAICAVGSRLKCLGKKVAIFDWSTIANHLRVTIYLYFSVLPWKHIW